tara:strand:+ start:36 stop:485 length:450 start_codon:yes stop_codon:yes gene_type:complete
MTSQLNVDTIVDKAGSGGTNVKTGNTSTYVSDGGNVTQNTVQGLIKAWMSMNGKSTIALFDSLNTTSITDNGSGDYTQTYTNAMGNNDYSTVISVRAQSSSYLNGGMIGNDNSYDMVTGNVRVTTNYAGGSSAREDRGIVNTQIAGDLA